MPHATLSADDLDHVLTHTRELWERARRQRIFLTSGTGFFGPWLVETFAHANEALDLEATLVVLTRDPAAALTRLPQLRSLRGVRLHRGDVRGFNAPAEKFDIIVHGAAESSQQGHVGDNRHMFDTIVDGTRNTLALARQSEAHTYLLLSSGAIYGNQPSSLARLGEDYSGGPNPSLATSAYGEAKRAAEVMTAIEAARTALSTRVARCFAFVGPHLPLDAHFAIGNFIRDAMAGGPIRIRGDGTAERSYLYMADLAIWLWTLALSEHATGAYNVGSEQGASILEVARSVAAACAPNAPIEVEGAARPAGALHRYVPSTSRAREQLGLAQTVALEDAVRRTVRWHVGANPVARA